MSFAEVEENAASSTTNSEEFEDAQDELRPLPERSALIINAGRGHNHLLRRDALPIENEINDVAINKQISIASQSGNMSTSSISSSLKDGVAADRRYRLDALRNRMTSEFGSGHTLLNAGGGYTDDDTGSASESSSLASWGRNLLMQAPYTKMKLVYPADTISTKAFSNHQNLNSGTDSFARNTNFDNDNGSRNIESTSPPHSPATLLLKIPCDNTAFGVKLPPPDSVPPPLPPRRPSGRLPNALSPQQVDSLIGKRVSPTKEVEEAKADASHSSFLTVKSEKPLKNDSISLVDGFARLRGHVKTNSLDRGLSLAKSMKSGPFPPRSDKSNSLKREYFTDSPSSSPYLSFDGGEEDLRNSDAQGVIRQITSSILNEPLKSDNSRCGKTYEYERAPSDFWRVGFHSEFELEDSPSTHSTPSSSSFGRAAGFVRGYGTYASELFRGAFLRAKNVVSSSSTSKFSKEDDESCNESDHEDSSIAEGTPIVRPRNSKKGPFDFDGTRCYQELNNEHTKLGSGCQRSLTYDELGESAGSSTSHDDESNSLTTALMASKPLCIYRSHTADVLDLSWSRNYFILSSGMDRTVKLWHLSRPECLCCFQHMDFVTCIAFMPKDDRYFLSGSLDGKLRLWHIPDKKVALWNEVEQVKFITAIAFAKNGKFAVVGTYDGRCFFYTTDQLKYHTVIDVRSSRGKNARGHKVTGLAVHGDKLLVTSNDSRIRMYDLRDMALTCKFKGAQNERSQIRASLSPDGKHIVCGSEDHFIYIWTTADLPSSLSVRKDRNDSWQRLRG
ncbi:hypothetical protein X798_04656 [Onchocerca flexuosa]|uniref:WD repeat-containing protein 44 n=1 Tax=Onchocerca flexuosa TaxID=387005 RepID=A0A238BUD2_9BILA|nr:hypothetical protein X798_04656 [Onchocerca flexuosa]